MTMNTNINDVNEIRICDDCGCVIETDDYYTTYDGRIICEDCYDSDYFTCEDCGKIFHIDDLISVNRGGSWGYFAEYCRSSYRDSDTPGLRNYDLGLRLALSE